MVVRSSLPKDSSKSLHASFRSWISSSVILSQASSIANFSREVRTSNTSLRSFSVIRATSAPFLGIITTRPSSSSLRIASRIGVRLTPSLLASAISIRRSPGSSSPLRIALLNVLNTTSLNGRYSSIVISKSFILPTSFFDSYVCFLFSD